jgi:hypothetical protein
VNPLGFYDLTLNASNTNSSLALDGVVVRDNKTTNFDVGPIAVKGNIFVDGLTAGIASTGLTAPNLTGLFPKSPIDQITNAITQQIETDNAVAGATATADVPALLLRTVLEQDPAATDQLISTLAANAQTDAGQSASTAAVVPEPGTLLLMGVGGIVALYRRRR